MLALVGACLSVLLAYGVTGPTTARAQVDGVVSPAGMIQIDRDGKEVAELNPGLFEPSWKMASMEPIKAGQIFTGGVHRGRIVAPSGKLVDVELRLTREQNRARLAYRLTPQADMMLNSLHVGIRLPTGIWAGGTFEADAHPGKLPSLFGNTILHSAPASSLHVTAPDGTELTLQFAEPTQVLVQDDRQWGESFSLRVGPQMGNGQSWAAGKALALEFTLSAKGGLTLEEDRPVTIQEGPEWLPLEVALDIEPESALDFTHVIPRHAPAGKWGRVVVNSDGHFAFSERPRARARFYGINLCFSAHYLEHEVADRLAERLARLGYNALRIHHYERELVGRASTDEVTLLPEKLKQLDYLFAALKKQGIYVTTDLFVSRPVANAKVYPGVPGEMAMTDYKMAVHVNARAYDDFKEFTRALLEHVNPYTGLRYAEDPALSWISMVNEDNPGNFASRLKGPLREDWQREWNQWLAKHFPNRSPLEKALGKLPDGQDPAKGNVPLAEVRSSSPAAITFAVFLAEVEQAFFDRTRRFLRGELQCDALLTDMNAWTNPMQMQAVRRSFDYVDDHFYVDHPQFIERPWSLPSRCPNASPIAAGARGGRPCAFTRMFGKPFTITEFNYSSPGRFRGVGGILTGALGALQDWDGIWRFAYSHQRDGISTPHALNYFDISSDPLNQAAERASLCLFLRGDLQSAEHAIVIRATEDQLLGSPTSARDKTPPWDALAWLTRVGWTVTDTPITVSGCATLPIVGGRLNPFDEESGPKIIDRLRDVGWVPSGNRTDLRAKRLESENGQVRIDAPENRFLLNTPKTVGGFAPAGARLKTEHVTIEIQDTDATVWISSLDGKTITTSKRLLITHLTDLQNSGIRYADRARRVLLEWGRLPHLVQNGRAVISLQVPTPDRATVYGLSTGGKRGSELETTTESDRLVIPLSVSDGGKARMLYEVTIP